MTRDRKLAEWLELKPELNPSNCVGILSYRKAWELGVDNETFGNDAIWLPRDFYTDEAANALLLEKMLCPDLWKNPNGQWTCEPNMEIGEGDEIIETANDRKTAIVNAALKCAALQRIERGET